MAYGQQTGTGTGIYIPTVPVWNGTVPLRYVVCAVTVLLLLFRHLEWTHTSTVPTFIVYVYTVSILDLEHERLRSLLAFLNVPAKILVLSSEKSELHRLTRRLPEGRNVCFSFSR